MNCYVEFMRFENVEFLYWNRGFRLLCVFMVSLIMECVVDFYFGLCCGFVGLVVLVGFFVEVC